MDTHNAKKQSSAAYRYPYSRMALNYYILYEAIRNETSISRELKRYTGEFHQVLQTFLTGDGDMEWLHKLRLQVAMAMEALTVYTDCSQIYEYALNQMECRFEDGMTVDSDVERFTSRLMEYLMTSGDTVIMNERIQQVIDQLPAHYTKQKFFKLLRDGLSVYIGSEKKSLEDMMYILRTESMVKLPERMERGYEDLYEILRTLCQADYLHTEKEEYRKCADRITYVSDKLFQKAGSHMLLQDLVSDLYMLHLTAPPAMVELSEWQVLEKTASGILNQFLESNIPMIDEAVTDILRELEGKQEGAMERYLFYPAPDEMEDDEMFHTLRKVDRLSSGSPFVSLDGTVEEDLSGTVGKEWLDSYLETFHGELNQLFTGMSKPVVRAIMAKLLSSLPVVFQSTDELSNYIMRSPTSCSNTAGREATMGLLSQETVNENTLV